MADRSKIEWTDASWNPVRAKRLDTGKVGWHCERVSPACAHCYAAAMNHRNLPGCGTGLDYVRSARDQVEMFIDEKTLLAPLKWKRPRKVFVCSMTDLFAEFVPFEMIDRAFSVMYDCHWHTFQVLTKRPDRMAEYFADHVPRMIGIGCESHGRMCQRRPDAAAIVNNKEIVQDVAGNWPLPNVWLGTTVENQEWADKRIPHLLNCPAAVRYLSCEPLLGPIDLTEHLLSPVPSGHRFAETHSWLIAGGESGREARPMHPDWPRSLRDQCEAAGVPFFFKQHGEWLPWDDATLYDRGAKPVHNFHDNRSVRVGKKAAGRLLGGVEHSEFPEAAVMQEAML